MPIETKMPALSPTMEEGNHRAIDGADGASLMRSFKTLVEAPLLLAA